MNIQKRELSEFIKVCMSSPDMKAYIKIKARQMLKKEIERRVVHLWKVLDEIKKDQEIPQ